MPPAASQITISSWRRAWTRPFRKVLTDFPANCWGPRDSFYRLDALLYLLVLPPKRARGTVEGDPARWDRRRGLLLALRSHARARRSGSPDDPERDSDLELRSHLSRRTPG